MSFAIRIAILCFLAAATSAQLFSYDPNAANGPANWPNLNLGPTVVNQCGGTANSPIAIKFSSSCDKKADYKFQEGNCAVENLEAVLLSNVLEIAFPAADVCTASTVQLPWASGTFAIKQFHIHALSEHQFNGGYFGAELHLVHQLVGGSTLSVIGIPIQATSPTDNTDFAPILSAWKAEYNKVLTACNVGGGNTRRFTALRRRGLQQTSPYNAYKLIPPGSSYYTYNGSLTTPPCTQGVLWNVVDLPLLVSVRQFQELTTIILGYRNATTCQLASVSSPSGSTSRPVQPLNGRRVKHICPSTSYNPSQNSKNPPNTKYTRPGSKTNCPPDSKSRSGQHL